MVEPALTLDHHTDSGRPFPLHVWRFDEPLWTVATGPLGGGIGWRAWIINATVHKEYSRLDPEAHLTELAAVRGLAGPGVGMLTAVDVRKAVTATDGGVEVTTTVGLGHPTWAAAADGDLRHVRPRPGTINIVARLPVRLGDAALVNAVATATEAKVQALWEYGVKATGTATDAIFVGCVRGDGPVEPYGGPRSTWGARLARAVHAAVAEGTRRWYESPV